MQGRFKIIVASFNCAKYLPQCLHSIEIQKGLPFDVCVIDDCSTIQEQRAIIADFCTRNGWQALYQPVNQGSLASTVAGIQALQCQNEDVIVLLDGDDWFVHNQVLFILQQAYDNPEVWATYGSFETYPKGRLNVTYAASTPEEVIEKQLYRHYPWIFHHLRTFKYFLWKAIRDEDLRDAQGQYFRFTVDRAFFYPILEMAGRHVQYINSVLYVYNLDNPLNEYKMDWDEQILTEYIIKSKPPYRPLHEKPL